MTNLEKNFLASVENKVYSSLEELRDCIKDKLNLLGLGWVKDGEDAYDKFHEDDEEIGMEDIHENIACRFECFVGSNLVSIIVKEYYVDAGSVDYYYSFEEY